MINPEVVIFGLSDYIKMVRKQHMQSQQHARELNCMLSSSIIVLGKRCMLGVGTRIQVAGTSINPKTRYLEVYFYHLVSSV